MFSMLSHGGWQAALVPVHLAIAIWATSHALLTKRDVGSALGWIGLVWFAPLLGGLIYFTLGINRVRRRARRLHRHHRVREHAFSTHEAAPEGFEPLQRGISHLSRRRLEGGNTIDIYQNGDEAYPVMIAAIEAATTSIGLSTYIMRADEAGSRFVEALGAAVKRGVAVRVIVDGLGSGWLLSPAYRALRKAGIPSARFLHSPLPWRMPLVNLRSHKKILVVDGRIGFTGGMNIADENVMASHPKHPVEDTHFRVQGPVVAQLCGAFADDWAFTTDEELEGPAWFPTLSGVGEAQARVVTSGPDQDIEKIEFCVLQAVSCARKSIYIMTPYFLPDERLITALSLAAMRGVAVHIIVPQRSNHVLIDWAARQNIGSMLKDGVNVWLGAPPFRHSKVMLVDGEWALIGSANWDMRSFRLNFELCMELYDAALVQKLQHFLRQQSRTALTNKEIKARTLPLRLRDASVRLMMPYL